MGLHIVNRTKMKLGESKDFKELPFKEIKRELEDYQGKGMKKQIIIEFHHNTGFWEVFTQEIFPPGIGGELYQEYSGVKLLEILKDLKDKS